MGSEVMRKAGQRYQKKGKGGREVRKRQGDSKVPSLGRWR